MRVLILSWEYPPLIEGGLARHVRKLAENLAAQGLDVHVLARGREEDPAEEEKGGVLVHRVREPQRPRDLSEFVAWIERMNSDMLAAGVELGDRYSYDLVHGHDWLVANACDHLARRFKSPLATTIHATEHGRHQGWVDKHPQSYIHGVERWITNRSDRVMVCSTFMREQVVDVFGVDEERVEVIPNGIDPEDLKIAELLARVDEGGVTEIVLATNPTTTGEATALHIAAAVHERAPEATVTRLASGLPVGADLEYADEVTLGKALAGRRAV